MKKSKILKAYLLYLCLACFFCVVELVILGKNSVSYGYGAFLETIPTHLALIKTNSLFANWAPFVACGVDRFAFWGNADPISFETLLIYFFPAWLANGIYSFLARIIGCFGSFLIARTVFRLGNFSALIAGLSHLAFSYYTFGGMFTSALVPWLLLFVKWACQKNKNYLWVIFGATLFGSLTSFIHGFPYLLFFCFLWFTSVETNKVSSYRRFAIFFIFLASWDLFQITALFANADLSARGSFNYGHWNWSRLFYFQPEYDYFDQDKVIRPFILFAPIAFLVGCFCFQQKKHSEQQTLFLKTFFIYVFLSQQWLFLGIQHFASFIIPSLKGIFMGRFFMVPYSFMVSLFPAFMIYFFQKKCENTHYMKFVKPAKALLVIFIISLIAWPKVGTFFPHCVNSFGQENYEVHELESIKNTSQQPFRVASVLPLQPAYAYGQGFESVDGWANLYSKYYREFWLAVLEPTLLASQSARDILNPSGGKPQDNYIFLGLGLGGSADIPEEHLVGRSNEHFDLNKRFRLPLLNLLNCKYLLSEYPVIAEGYLQRNRPSSPMPNQVAKDYATGVWNGPGIKTWPDSWKGAVQDFKKSCKEKSQGKNIYIYENKNFLPRIYFVEKISGCEDDRNVLECLAHATAEELSKTAYVTKNELEKCNFTHFGAYGSVFLAKGYLQETFRKADEYHWLFSSPNSSFLSISVAWSPYWRAYLNGEEIPVLRTNHALMGLALPPCTTIKLKLIYRPPYSSVFTKFQRG